MHRSTSITLPRAQFSGTRTDFCGSGSLFTFVLGSSTFSCMQTGKIVLLCVCACVHVRGVLSLVLCPFVGLRPVER